MAGNQITFGVGFNVNESGLNKLKQSLQEIQKLTSKDLMGTGNFTSLRQAEQTLNQVKASASQVQAALAKAFNPSLGTTNVAKFNQEIQKLNVGNLATQFNQLGATGQSAFLQIAQQSLALNAPLKQNVGWLQKMGQTLTNQIKWHIASSAINTMTNSIQSAFNYVKVLDSSLTDIRIVTGQSRDEMAAFALEANNAAQALGRQTKEYTNAALSFYQQGLSDEEVRVRTEATLKAQNITGAGSEIADELTAVWNGFQVNIEESELAVDKLAAVADSSASNMSELATGMSKTASVASSMGVTIDQLTAQLATIIATTRQAPASVGNALKTIYTRINDIKTGSDEAEVSLGNYSAQMAKVGINVLDVNGHLRDTGEVIEEIGGRWNTLSREQQIYLARTMAGQRQMNNLVALFDNWTKYSEMLNVSLNAQGALNEKNSRYMESLSAHINQFKAATEGFQDSLLDQDGMISFYDAGTKIMGLLDSFVNSIGGMRGALIGLGAIGASAFKNQIAEAIAVAINNLRAYRQNIDQVKAQQEVLKLFNTNQATYNGLADGSNFKLAIDNLRQLKLEFSEYTNIMTASDQQAISGLLEQKAAVDSALLSYEELVEQATKLGNAGLGLSRSYGFDTQENFEASDILSIDIASGTGKLAEEGQKNIEDLISQLRFLKEEYSDFKNTASDLRGTLRSNQELTDKVKAQREFVKQLEEQWKKLGPAQRMANGDAAERLQKERNILKQLEQEYEEIQTQIKNFKNVVSEAANQENLFGTNTQKVKDLLSELGQPGKDDTQILAALLQIFEESGSAAEQYIRGLRGLQDNLNRTNTAAHQTTAAFQQLKQSLEDAKIAQSLANMLQGVSSLAMGIQSLSAAHKTYQEMQEGTIDSMEGWLRIIMSLSMALPMITSGVKNIVTSIGPLAGGIGKATTALGGFIQSSSAAGASFVGLTSKAFAGAAALGVIAAVVAGVIVGLVALYKHLTKNTRAWKEDQKELEKLNQTYSETQSKYKELTGAIEKYQSTQDALSKLTKGTEEWKDMIVQANDAVQELMEAFPELASKVHFDENGNPIISDEDLEAAQINARRQQFIAGANAKRQEVETATSAVSKDAEGISPWNPKDIEERAREMYDNPALKTFFTTALEDRQKAIDTALNQAIEEQKDTVGILDAQLQDILYASAYFTELTNAEVQLSDKYTNLDAVITRMFENREELRDADSENYQKLTDEFDNSYELITQFLSDIDTYSLLGKKGNQILEDIGEEQKARNSLQAQLTSLAMVEVMELQTKNKNLAAAIIAARSGQVSTVEELGTLIDDTEEIVNKISNFFNDDQGVLNALATFAGGRAGNLTNLTKDQFGQTYNTLVKYYEDFGFKSILDLQKAFFGEGGAVAQWNQAFETVIAAIPDSIEESVRSVIEKLKEENLISPDQAEDISQAFTKAASKGKNLDIFRSLENIFNKLGNKAGDFATELNKIDWDNLSFEELQSILDDLGFSTSEGADGLDGLGTAIEDFVQKITGATETIVSFNDLADKFKKGNDIVKDIEWGDIISAKDYLEGLAPYEDSIEGLRQMFTRMPTGEYYFNGSGDDLRELFNAAALDDFNKALNIATSKLEELDQVPSYEELINMGTSRDSMLERLDYLRSTGYDPTALNAWQERIKDANDSSQFLKVIPEILAALKEWGNRDSEIESKKTQYKTDIDNYREAGSFTQHEWDSDVKRDELKERAEFLKRYGEELYGISQDLEKNEEAARLIAEDFLRAEAAAKDVASNIEDWQEALKDPQKDMNVYVKALQSIENDYKDLLNLSQEATLSSEFLNSAENLDLMEQAINGNIEAYQQLSDLAQQDILHQGIIDNTDGGFAISATVDTTALEADLMEKINMMENSIDDIEIGAELDDANFIAGLNEIINAAGLTADQATALLASMGIDAEVVDGPPEDVTTPASFSYYKPPVYDLVEKGQMTTATGGQVPFIAPDIVEEGRIETRTESQNNTSPSAFAIHVKNAKKGVGSGGNINHKKASGLGGGGGRKSGGGGGGGKQPKQPKKTEKFKAKIDPYHDVNIKIGDTQEGLEKLEKQRDKLMGKNAIDNLTKQINLMEKEKELLQEKAKIAQEELQKQADELAAHGAIIDKQGNILNYKELLLAKQEQINKAIDIANGLDAESQETYLKYVEDLKKEYKELEEGIKNLDDTKQLLDDLGLDYIDLINKQIELAMEAFNLEIDVHLDTTDAQKEFNEFRKKVIDQVKDDQYGGLAAAAARNYGLYFNNQNTGIVSDLQQHAQQIQQEAEIIRNGGFSQIYGDNLAAAAEDLKKYNDALMSALEEAQDVIDEVHEDFLSAIDAMNEAFDTQQENLDKIDDLLQHDIDILQLIHGEENYEELGHLLDQQIQQDTKRLSVLKAEQDFWQQKLNEYEKGTEEWKRAMSNWQDAFEKTQEAMLRAVENANKKWENNINQTIKQLGNQLYGGNMDRALENWEKTKWHSDRYLDNLERANGLMNLQNKYTNALNKNLNPKQQEELLKLEQYQLDALAEKEHLREIDLQLAEKEFEIMQARYALENAQQSKTKLRLRRDSQGNYTYQYVADENEVQDKLIEYTNQLEEYRQLVKKNTQEDLDLINDYTQEFLDKVKKAALACGDDQAQLQQRMRELWADYYGENGYIHHLVEDSNEDQKKIEEVTKTEIAGLLDVLGQQGVTAYDRINDSAAESAEMQLQKIQELADKLGIPLDEIEQSFGDTFQRAALLAFDYLAGPNDESVLAIASDLLTSNDGIPGLLDMFTNDYYSSTMEQLNELTDGALFDPESGIFPEWGSALADIVTKYDEEVIPAVQDAMGELIQSHMVYIDELHAIEIVSSRTFKGIALGLAYDTAYTQSLDQATQALLQTQDAQLSKAEEVYESLKKTEEAFKDQTKAAIDAANGLFLYWLALNGMSASGVPYGFGDFGTDVNVTPVSTWANEPATSSYNGDYSGDDYGGDGGGSGESYGDSRSSYSDSSSAEDLIRKGASMAQNKIMSGNVPTVGGRIDPYTNKKLPHYSSGGYTGDWGTSEGSLAVLHEKELVLNADDTKNMLNAVNIVRAIADKVSSMTNAAAANIGAQNLGSLLSAASEQILQNVVINADFPAVQDAAQIKQAFNELVNLASQRASANNRAR